MKSFKIGKKGRAIISKSPQNLLECNPLLMNIRILVTFSMPQLFPLLDPPGLVGSSHQILMVAMMKTMMAMQILMLTMSLLYGGNADIDAGKCDAVWRQWGWCMCEGVCVKVSWGCYNC